MAIPTESPTQISDRQVLAKKNEKSPVEESVDIEHVLVEDDPRKWSPFRKNVTLTIISFASMIAGISCNIQNPSNQQIQDRLHASPGQISWSISAFILAQGVFPLFWSAVSEIKGRKLVYLTSIAIFVVGSIVVATSNSIRVLIGFRVFQAAGSSAVLAIGAATLADVFDPFERGTKVGIYYMAPMLGPALGPILGGVLTQGFDWRGPFWFLAIFGGLNLCSFLFLFKDTFRKQRSLTYQLVVRRHILENESRRAKQASKETVSSTTIGHISVADSEKTKTAPVSNQDIELQLFTPMKVPAVMKVKVSLKDVNPIGPLWKILRRNNNIAILFASGLLFAFSFSITYTATRTLDTRYHYNALQIGLILLSYGIGSLVGSIGGGRWSDRMLEKLKAENGGVSYPEMRLKSTLIGMWFLPPSVIAFAWVSQKHLHVSAIAVFLFFCGFFSIWIYTSTLAYIVDANVGRSSMAVAANSAFRGCAAFVATEVAIPLQDAVGDGWMYTIWAVLMIISQFLILLVMWKGGEWRAQSEKREDRDAKKQNSKTTGV